jgi:3-hydroxymyristoyl/3-hydroxydecanoyl-(acyl carrier protein) dehydratase
VLNKRQILDLIPHRPPFLWIDRVAELDAGVRCVALKFVDPSEVLFEGHFPGNPILPGVIIIEAAAQTAAVMLGSQTHANHAASSGIGASRNRLLAAVNRFKFLKPVKPGSELRIETRKVSELGAMAYVAVTVHVDSDLIARGELAVTSA